MQNQKLYLIKVTQKVFPTFQHLLNEAREIGDYEIVDTWTYRTLRSRGFEMTLEESQ